MSGGRGCIASREDVYSLCMHSGCLMGRGKRGVGEGVGDAAAGHVGYAGSCACVVRAMRRDAIHVETLKFERWTKETA